jgi:predicted RND superfamily exporter protein
VEREEGGSKEMTTKTKYKYTTYTSAQKLIFYAPLTSIFGFLTVYFLHDLSVFFLCFGISIGLWISFAWHAQTEGMLFQRGKK